MIQVVSRGKFVRFLAGCLVGIAVLVGWWMWSSSTIAKSGELEIVSGDTGRAVWARLVAEGYSAWELPWRYYAWRQGAADQLKAGTYHLTAGESITAVLERFVAGDTNPDEVSITYPEGFTLAQMAERTAARGIGTPADFTAAATPTDFTEAYPYLRELGSDRTLEGYLFPDTYRIFADDTPVDVVRRMLSTFDRRFTEELRQEAIAAGRTLDEIVIMASVIEREVLSDEDMALISGVLWKRFDEGIGLDADATIRYAVENWDTPLTVAELQVDSPYNTRRYRGLPPGPISNPGMRALTAAVRPQASEFYYYLSAPNGETVFARTNDEHNQNKAKYLR